MNEPCPQYDPNNPIQNLECWNYDPSADAPVELSNQELDIETVCAFPLTQERAEYLSKIENNKLDLQEILSMCASEDIAIRYVGALCLEEMNAFPEEEYGAVLETAKILCRTLASEEICEVGFCTLAKLGGEKAFETLDGFMGNDLLRPHVLETFCAFGKEGFKFVLKWVTLNKDRSHDEKTQEAVKRIAMGLGESSRGIQLKKILTLLAKITEIFNNNQEIRLEAAISKMRHMVRNAGDNEKLLARKIKREAKGNLPETIHALFKIAPECGELGMALLKGLLAEEEIKTDPTLMEIAIKSLTRLGIHSMPNQALRILQAVFENTNIKFPLREKAQHAIAEIMIERYFDIDPALQSELYIYAPQARASDKADLKAELLPTNMALYATPHSDLCKEKYKRLQQFAQDAQHFYPDSFFGILVFGSMARGHYHGGSDIDAIVIIQEIEDEDTMKKFFLWSDSCFETFTGEDLESIRPGLLRKSKTDDVIKLMEMNTATPLPTNVSQMLFCPMHRFIGDMQKLSAVQREMLNSMSRQQWDRSIGEGLIPMLADTDKMGIRFGLTQKERRQLKKQIILVQCPLNLEKMRELF